MFHQTQLRAPPFGRIVQCACVSMPRSTTASSAACWQHSQHIRMECSLQSSKPVHRLTLSLTYPVVAEVPGEDSRSKGAGGIHPRASVIHLQKTQLRLRPHPASSFSSVQPVLAVRAAVLSLASSTWRSTSFPRPRVDSSTDIYLGTDLWTQKNNSTHDV